MNLPIRQIFSTIVLSITASLTYAQCDPVLITDTSEILFDGPVNKFVVQDHYLYAGGSFNTVGKFTGSFTELNKTTGRALYFPQAAGTADGIPDGSGGMIVFGSFSKIKKDSLRTNIAIVNANRQVTPFNTTLDGNINAAVVYNGVLYIGGYFSNVNGVPRNKLAAINLSTGLLTPWDPNVTNSGPLPCRIECMMQSGGQIYIGGAFSTIGTTARKNIAALDANTGTVNSWAPQAYFASNPNYGTVIKMLKVNNLLFVCGQFDYVGGKTHGDVAAIDLTTAISTNWKPDPNSVVFALANKGDTLYLGGAFYNISGLPRKGFAAFSISSGSLLPIAIDTKKILNERIYSILAVNDTLYLGGTFDTIANQRRKNLAAFNRLTGTALPWQSYTNGDVLAINHYNNRLYIGGRFYGAGMKFRANLAAIDADVDTVTDWDPNINGEVKSINPRGKTIYIGGVFTKAGDSLRAYNAAIDKITAKVLKWNPQADNVIYGIEQYNNETYIGGTFQHIQGQARNGLAKLDSAGNVSPWIGITGTGSAAYALEQVANKLYVGGSFNNLGGQSRGNLGAIYLSTGLATNWLSNPPNISVQYFLTKKDFAIFFVNYYSIPVTRPYGPDSTMICEIVDGPTPSLVTFPFSIHNGKIYNLAVANGRLYPVGSFNNRLKYRVLTLGGPAVPFFESLKKLGDIDARTQFPPFPVGAPAISDFDGGYSYTLDTIYTAAVYGNKLYVGGMLFSSVDAGHQNADEYQLITAELNADIATDTNGVCSGIPVTVQINSSITRGATYQWSVNGVNITNPLSYYTYVPNNKDSINCIVTVPANTCMALPPDTTGTIKFLVTPTVTPDISISGPADQEAGKPVTVKALVKDAATGYTIEWFNKGISIGKTTADSITYTKGSGDDSIYAVITPRTDTCYVTDTSGLITIAETVGITSAKGDNKVIVYPNPFDTYVKIAGLNEGDMLVLYDVTGRKVTVATTGTKQDYLLETGRLRTGVYVLKITDAQGILRKTMLIQKQ